jgi:hypothetical protein
MEEHPLLRTVANWPGRGPTELAFEALGFTIHKARQNRVIQFCGEQQSHLLNRYWDEIALETMQSLGQGDPDQRASDRRAPAAPEYCVAVMAHSGILRLFSAAAWLVATFVR